MTSGAEVIGHPWATIWTKPRATIRRIIETDVHYQVMFLAVLSGAVIWLERRWSNPTTAAAFPVLVVIAVVVGALIGIVELYVNGALLKWSGAALGGVGSYAEVRAALAWSRIPVIVAFAIGILAILLGNGGPTIPFEDNPPETSAGMGLLHAVLVIWWLVIMLKCVGEVHRFSAWRALGSILLVLVGIAVALAVAVFVFGGIGRIMHPVVAV